MTFAIFGRIGKQSANGNFLLGTAFVILWKIPRNRLLICLIARVGQNFLARRERFFVNPNQPLITLIKINLRPIGQGSIMRIKFGQNFLRFFRQSGKFLTFFLQISHQFVGLLSLISPKTFVVGSQNESSFHQAFQNIIGCSSVKPCLFRHRGNRRRLSKFQRSQIQGRLLCRKSQSLQFFNHRLCGKISSESQLLYFDRLKLSNILLKNSDRTLTKSKYSGTVCTISKTIAMQVPDLNINCEYADYSSLDVVCEEKPQTGVVAQIQKTRAHVGVPREAPTVIAQVGGLRLIKEGRRLKRYRQGV